MRKLLSAILAVIFLLGLFACDAPCAHEHTSQSVTKQPTCAQSGITLYVCNDCGARWQEKIFLQHEPISKTVAPTCYSRGYVKTYCRNCEYQQVVFNQEVVSHKYETKTVQSTCSASGYTRTYCVYCDKTQNMQTLDKPPHFYVFKNRQVACKTCHTVYRSDCPHQFEQIEIIEPKIDQFGYTKIKCALCDLVCAKDITPAI